MKVYLLLVAMLFVNRIAPPQKKKYKVEVMYNGYII